MKGLAVALCLLIAAPAVAQKQAIIDMHAHALPIDYYGPVPQRMCFPLPTVPPRDPATPARDYYAQAINVPCDYAVQSATTNDELRARTLESFRRNKVLALLSGPADTVEAWRRDAPDDILVGNWDISPARPIEPQIEKLRAQHKAGKLAAIGEVVVQYQGIDPDDPRMEPFYALAEELYVPIGIHIGPGPPGVAYYGSPKMRALSPLRLQEVLLRHPKMRLWVMHAGWPLADDMVALMYAHPQVYVDVGVIDNILPRATFYSHLRRLIDAGYEDRVIFGSDNMLWPEVVEAGIKSIREAPFLTPVQKQEILYDNAARFLRLDAKKP